MTLETDHADWVIAYVDLLEEVGALRKGFREALELIEELLADPFVRYRSGVWGGLTLRLSEWEESYWEHGAPIAVALGLTPRLPPYLAAIRRTVQRERAKQAMTTPQARGGLNL